MCFKSFGTAHEHYFLLAMVAIHINLAHFPQILLMHTTGLVEIVNITCTAGLSAVVVQMQLRETHAGYVLSKALVM